MTSPSESAEPARSSRLTADRVRRFLTRHPDFLNRHPALLTVLTPPAYRNGEGVLDMQRFMLDRLQREVIGLKNVQDEILAASRGNLSSQAKIHAAVLALMEARTFDDLIRRATADLATLIDVDVVSLCVEAVPESEATNAITCGVRILEPDAVAGWFGEAGDVVLRSDIAGDGALYGEAASHVRAEALLRLDIGTRGPAGMLALGSRHVERFHSGQATDLLNFLGAVLGRAIRGWLHLPA